MTKARDTANTLVDRSFIAATSGKKLAIVEDESGETKILRIPLTDNRTPTGVTIVGSIGLGAADGSTQNRAISDIEIVSTEASGYITLKFTHSSFFAFPAQTFWSIISTDVNSGFTLDY